MRIDHLTIEGLRSTDRSVALAPLTLLLGGVGAGKTSVCDAIRIVALGCVPSIGRDPKAMAKLMRNGRLRVAARMDDGRLVERGYVLQGDRLKGSASASWMPPKSGQTESSVAIQALVGRDDDEASEHLDLRQLLTCSPNERARRIEQLLDASGIAIEDLVTRARAMATLRLADVDLTRMPADPSEAGAAAAGVRSLIPPATRAPLPGVLATSEEVIRTLGLAGAIEIANEKKREGASEDRRLREARAQIEDRVSALGAPTESLEDITRRREAAIVRRAAAARDLEAAEEAARVRGLIEPALPALRKSVEDAKQELRAAVELLAAADKMKAEIARLVDPPTVDAPEVATADPDQLAEADRLLAEAAATPEPLLAVPDMDAIERAHGLADESARLTAEADEMEIPEPISTAEAESRVKSWEEASKCAARSPWREVETIAERVDELFGTDEMLRHLRILGEDGESLSQALGLLDGHMKRLHALAREHGGDEGKITENIEGAHILLDCAREASETRAADIESDKHRREDLRKRAAEANAEAVRLRDAAIEDARKLTEKTRLEHGAAVNDLRTRAAAIRKAAEDAAALENKRRRDVYAELVGEREGQAAEITALREALRTQEAEIRSAAVAVQSALDRAESDLRAATERLAGIESVTVDPVVAQSAIAMADAEIPELDAKLAALQGIAALRDEMKAILCKIEEATARRDCWTAVEWALQQLRSADIAARASGLEERMRRYLRAAGRSEDPFLRTGKASCDFGWRRDGQEIAVEALSGGEAAIFCATLLGAILAIRRPPLRLLLVEAAEVGIGPESGQLLAACAEMVTSGDIDQAVAATCLPLKAAAPWVTVDLGREVAESVA